MAYISKKDVRLVGGPHQGEMVDGDKNFWYVGSTLIPMNDGEIYRRRSADEAIYEGKEEVLVAAESAEVKRTEESE